MRKLSVDPSPQQRHLHHHGEARGCRHGQKDGVDLDRCAGDDAPSEVDHRTSGDQQVGEAVADTDADGAAGDVC